MPKFDRSIVILESQLARDKRFVEDHPILSKAMQLIGFQHYQNITDLEETIAVLKSLQETASLNVELNPKYINTPTSELTLYK